jgi:hypothetical protein
VSTVADFEQIAVFFVLAPRANRHTSVEITPRQMVCSHLSEVIFVERPNWNVMDCGAEFCVHRLARLPKLDDFALQVAIGKSTGKPVAPILEHGIATLPFIQSKLMSRSKPTLTSTH